MKNKKHEYGKDEVTSEFYEVSIVSAFNEFNRRRNLISATPFDISILNLKSHIIAVCWSFAFPGFGHFYVNNFVFGMILMMWEFSVNTLGRVSLCIYYSLQGNFEAAKTSANLKWFISYILVYV